MKVFETIKQLLHHSLYLQHVLTHMTGTVVSQLLILCSAPILTRLYTPEDFGIFGLYFAVLAPFQVLASWRYELAIVLPQSDDDARCLMGLSFLLLSAMTVATALICFFWGPQITNLLTAPGLGKWLMFLPVSLFIVGLFNIFNYWSTRKNKFRHISIAKVLQSSSTLTGQLGTGVMLHSTVFGLLASSILGQAIGAITLIRQNLNKQNFNLSRDKIVAVARRYWEIPLNTIQTAFLNTCSKSLLPIVISYFFGSYIVGIILLAERVLLAPMNLITKSIWEISHSRLGKLAEAQKRELLNNVHKVVALAFAYPFAYVFMFSEYCATFFGQQWENLNLIFPAFALMIYFNSISNATSYFVAFEKYKIESWINIALFVIKCSVLIIGSRFFSAIKVVNLYAVICALVYFGINIYWGKVVHNLKAFLTSIFKGLSISFIISMAVKFTISIHYVVAIILFAVCTYGYYWKILQSSAGHLLNESRNRSNA